MSESEADEEYQQMLDERAIVDAAIRYTWALDEKDWSALDDVFVLNATARLGDKKVLEGRQAIVDRCTRALNQFEDSQHLVGNHQVVIDGKNATHRCYLQAQHVPKKGSGAGLYVVGGRYEDKLARTGDGWRIRHRDLVIMWTTGEHTPTD